MPIAIAALLPWEEPVGEWVTVSDLNGEFPSILHAAAYFNRLLTRKYGQPPVKEGSHEC